MCGCNRRVVCVIAVLAWGKQMGSFSIWHWLIVIIAAAIFIIPFWRILPRSGIPSWVAIFAVIPLFAVLLLWIVAFKRWPTDAARS